MISPAKRWVAVGVFLLVMVVSASTLERIARENSPITVAPGLRNDLVSRRGSIDACLTIRGQWEIQFQMLTRETELLREALDSLEALDPRGVPEELYEAYMSDVEAFNESIPQWERQADGLRTLSARCDSLVRDHNVRADSLQEFLVSEGIWEGRLPLD